MLGRKGFTLVELLVVIIIVGILAAVSIPMITGNRQRACATEAVAVLGVVRNKFRLVRVETGAYNKLPDGTILMSGDPVYGLFPDLDLDGTFYVQGDYWIEEISDNAFKITAYEGSSGVGGSISIDEEGTITYPW